MPSFRGIRQILRGGAGAGRGDAPYTAPSSGIKPPPPPMPRRPSGPPPPPMPGQIKGGGSSPQTPAPLPPHGADGIHRPQAPEGGTPKHKFTEYSSETSYKLRSQRDRLASAQRENKARISNFAVDKPDDRTRAGVMAHQIKLDKAVEDAQSQLDEHESLAPRRVGPPKPPPRR